MSVFSVISLMIGMNGMMQLENVAAKAITGNDFPDLVKHSLTLDLDNLSSNYKNRRDEWNAIKPDHHPANIATFIGNKLML